MANYSGSIVGEDLGWTVQTAVTLSNTNTTHVDCTNAKLVHIETSHTLDINFGAAEADNTDNDIELAAGVYTFTVPKALGNSTILNYRRASSSSTVVRVVLS
jgi:hypothetical protein